MNKQWQDRKEVPAKIDQCAQPRFTTGVSTFHRAPNEEKVVLQRSKFGSHHRFDFQGARNDENVARRLQTFALSPPFSMSDYEVTRVVRLARAR